MLVNITEYFIEAGREWKVGQNPDVPREVAARWIADGKATADTDGARNQFPVSGGGGVGKVPRGSAIRIFDGRAEATHTIVHASGPGETFLSVFELAAAPDWVRPIWINGGAASYDIYGGKVAVLTQGYTNLIAEIAAATWTSTGSGTVPALVATAPGLLRASSAPLNVPNPNRSKTVAVLSMVQTYGSDITLTVMGKGADGSGQVFTNWASRAGHRVTFRRQVGNCITTPSTFVSTTDVSYAVCVGIEYGCQGRVYTVMGVGDSTESGQGTYKASGVLYEAVRVGSALGAGVIGEVANLGIAGSTVGTSYNLFSGALTAGLVPDICVRAIASINGTGLTLAQTDIDSARYLSSKFAALCGANGVLYMPRTWAPTNYTGDTPPGSKNYGATDLLRQGLNAECLASFRYALDFATPIESAPRGDGSKIHAYGMTSDGTHANDAGIAATVAYNATRWPVLVW